MPNGDDTEIYIGEPKLDISLSEITGKDDNDLIYIGVPKSDISLQSTEEKRENYRGVFATTLICAYLVIAAFIVLGAMSWKTPDGGLDTAVTVLSLIGPIVGTVVGFYFGDSRKS